MKDDEQIAIRIARLREFYAMDQHGQFAQALRRLVADPLRPKTERGSLRVNPILVLLAGMALLTGATFLLFSFIQL
jgi:hypothetical protein